MSLQVGTGKAAESNELLDGLQRGRHDVEFFGDFFLGRRFHSGQLEYLQHAEAKVNVLACSNRWGKTTMVAGRHFHRHIYKKGAEDRYLDDQGVIDLDRFNRLKYETAHTAGEWEQAAFAWEDAYKLIEENPRLAAFVADAPKSKPPHIRFIHGSKWMFRTLGINASGIDGKSLYLLGIDEAGWIGDLDRMMGNVLKIRTADVRGVIDIIGTFKPGISRDFYKIAVRASAYTGRGIGFAHGAGADEEAEQAGGSLDDSIRLYLREFGIDLDEYRDAVKGE